MSSAQYLSWWMALAGVSAVSTASTAFACGALPTPTFGFAAQQPDVSVQALPRNASIVLHLTCSVSSDEAPIVQATSCAFTPLGSKVSLRAVTGGDEVQGRLVVRPDALIFLPAAPLAADTDYALTASLGSFDVTSARASFSSQLHTGDGMLSPLASASPPSVVAEWYDAPITQCDNVKLAGKAALDALTPGICPGPNTNCHAASGTQRMLRLHANFAALSGGSGALPYAAQLKLSAGGLSGFDGSEGAAPASPPENTTPPPAGIVLSWDYATALAPSGIDLFVDLLPPDDPKAMLCARARAFDAAGQVLYAPDHCDTYVGWMTDAEWAAEAAAEAASQPNGSTAGTSQTDAAVATLPAKLGGGDPATTAPATHEDGCSVRGARRALTPSTLAGLGICIALTLRRRRNGRRTQA